MWKNLSKILLILFGFVLIHLSGTSGMRRNFFEDRVCATFYSEVGSGGNSFVLGDEDQSVNTKRDYRSSIDGWGNTRSIRVEENCTLSACSGAYFDGSCTSYPAGNLTGNFWNSSIQSASCTCSKVCKCEDIVIQKNDDACGRAYVNGTCNECDSQYLPLRYEKDWWDLPSEYAELVGAIALRSGCQLTVYTQSHRRGDSRVINGPIVQDFQGIVGSYECTCDDDMYSAPLLNVSVSSLNLPSSSDQLLEMTFSNATLAQHPGLLAAKASLQSGRSHRNAYILIIGTIVPGHTGLFWKCGLCVDEICECQVALDIPELGISQAQIRVIWGSLNTIWGSDARWVASLDQYLATHEGLKDSIPNAVIVYHYDMHDSTIAHNWSIFQKKLAAVDALRGRLLDENYSNLLFVVAGSESICKETTTILCGLVRHLLRSSSNSKSKRDPTARISAFEAAIDENWNFPRPTVVLPVQGNANVKVNGRRKTGNGRDYIQNVYRALLLASDMSGDALGHAIFKAAFPVHYTDWTFLKKTVMRLLPENHTSVRFQEQLASDSVTLQAFTTHTKMYRAQKLSFITDKIRREEQFANFVLTMRRSEVTNTCSHCQDFHRLTVNTPTRNENLQWRSVSTLTLASRKAMHNFGLVNGRGIRLYVCRGFVKGVIRVGSFNFEDGACQIWYKKLISLTENAEVLLIPGGITKIVKSEDSETGYRLQFEIVSSHQIPGNASSELIVPVFAGNSHPRNANKYIAFATFAEEGENGLETVDTIGTASLYPPNAKLARFAGVGRPLKSVEFKVFVLTKTKIHRPTNI